MPSKPSNVSPIRPQASPLSAEGVAQAIDQLPARFLYCRFSGHQWTHKSARWDEQAHCFEQTLRCGQCGTDRTRQIGPRGELMGSSYVYPDEYTMPPGTGRMTADDRARVRFVAIVRLARNQAVAS